MRPTFLNCLLILLLVLFMPAFGAAQDEKRAAIAILIDNTGSMRAQFDNVIALATGVVQVASKRGTVSLFSFETNASAGRAIAVPGTAWTQDTEKLERSISDLFVQSGQTTLYDAIAAAATAARDKADADKLAEKIVVVISDGEDRASKLKRDELIKLLSETGVKVYAVGMTGQLGSTRGIGRKSDKDKATEFLQKLASETGGALVTLSKNDKTVGDVITKLFDNSRR